MKLDGKSTIFEIFSKLWYSFFILNMNQNIHWDIWILQEIRSIVSSSNIVKRYWYKFSNFGDLSHFFTEDTNEELRRVRNDVAEYLENEISIFSDEINILQERISEFSQKEEKFVHYWIFGGINFLRRLYYRFQLTKLRIQLEKKQKLLWNALDSFDCRLHSNSQKRLQEFIEDKNVFIRAIKPLKTWAEWEIAVLNNLKNLPSDFTIINNFWIQLSRSIYDPKTRSYIKSIQVDHIVIWANWVFCIETKNWEKDNNQYYNPIKQNERHSLILYILIKEICWRDIPIKNIIASNVTVNNPLWNNSYAKVLKHNDVAQYILHYANHKSQISANEVMKIKRILLEMKDKWVVYI